jgi:hypothetical protein
MLVSIHLRSRQKFTSTDKGKSPMYAEKSTSFNAPDEAYPYPQDFDKPTQISSAPTILPTTPDKGLPLFNNPAQFLEYISKWADPNVWPGLPLYPALSDKPSPPATHLPNLSHPFPHTQPNPLAPGSHCIKLPALPVSILILEHLRLSNPPLLRNPLFHLHCHPHLPLPSSPDIQSGFKSKKRLNIPEDDLPLASLFKQKKLKHLDQILASQMSMAADSLAALKYSRPPVSSAQALNIHESSLTEVHVRSSPDLQVFFSTGFLWCTA